MILSTLIGSALLIGAVPMGPAEIIGPTPLSWRWVQPTSVPPSGSPVVSEDTIYMAVGQRVYALDLLTGNEKWKYPKIEPLIGFSRTEPEMVGTSLVFTTDNRIIYGIDAKSGDHLWMTRTEPRTPLGSPVALGDAQFALAFSDDTIQAFDVKTGQPVGEAIEVEGGIVGQIAGHRDSAIVITQTSEMASINGTTGRTNWRARFNSIPADTLPVIKDDMIYINSGSYIVALNASTGRMRWQEPFRTQIAFGPAVSDTHVLAMDRGGLGMVYDLNGRRLLREPIRLDSFPSARPAAIGDKFVVPTANGGLNLIDTTTGQVLWTFTIRPLKDAKAPTRGKAPTTVPASGPPIAAGNTLLVLARDGSLLAFNPETGIDLTPPSVEMVWPPPGAQVSGQPPLEFIVTTEDLGTGIKDGTLQIDIDGQPLKFEVDDNGVAFAPISIYGDNKPLMDGRKVVTVKAEDWMGNKISRSYALVIDNMLPPLRKPVTTPQKTTTGGGGDPGAAGAGP